MEFLRLWEIFLRRKWIFFVVFSICMLTAVCAVLIIPPTYEATAKLLVQTSRSAESVLTVLGLKELVKTRSSTDDSYETDITMVTIRPLLDQLISDLGLKNRGGETIKTDKLTKFSLLNKVWPQPYIEVEQCEDADILEVTATSSDPQEAADMSNKLADLYIQDIRDRNAEEYGRARGFIEGQIKKVKDQYYEALAQKTVFKLKGGIADLDLETQNMINKISSLKSDIQDNERNIQELEKKIAEEEAKLRTVDRYRKDSEQLAQNDQVKTLKTTLNNLVIELSERSLDITKEHQDYKQILKKMSTVTELLKEEALMVVSGRNYGIDPIFEKLTGDLVTDYISKETALVRRKVLDKYLGEYQGQLMQMPIRAEDAAKLDLSLNVSKEIYQNLLEYMTQIGIAETMLVADKVLVESAAAPYEHVFPKKSVSLFLGLLFGLFWGGAVAVFFELIDNTVKYPEDLKKFQSLAFLGAIPYSKDIQRNSRLDPARPTVESFRTIRYGIKYAAADKSIKSLVITSAIENEGKSRVGSHLAQTFAMGGGRSVLVDMNFRSPMVDKIFELPNTGGVTDILVRHRPFGELVQESGVKGLDIITSGRIPPDPGGLVESKEVGELIRELEAAYDMVLIDAPSMIVNDPVILGRAAGGMMLVIESGRVTFQTLDNTVARLGQAGMNVTGAALNKFKPTHLHRY